MTRNIASIRRRDLLNLAIITAVAGIPWRPADAEAGDEADVTAPVQRLDAALLASMKAGQSITFSQRFATLAPVIEQTFDLEAVLADSIGLRWPELTAEQKAQLLDAFRRYTVASYAANFDSYAGQKFAASRSVRNVGNGEFVVQTEIVPTDGSATQLDYVMRNGQYGWRVVDVLADGSISRVAVQRSDFRHLLTSGGTSALMAGLQNKVASLSGGMLS